VYELAEKEFETLSAAEAPEQYGYFVERCVENEQVWALIDEEDNWAAFGAPDEGVMLCVWPHPRFAEACAYGDWSSRETVPVDVEVFVEEVLPDLIREGTLVAVFPTEDTAVPVEPERLMRDMAYEMGRRGIGRALLDGAGADANGDEPSAAE
jgi:hypothetical protein